MMRNRKAGLLLILVVLSAGSRAVSGQDSTLIPFNLRDQFGKGHSRTDYSNSVVVLIGSDRAGGKYSEKWGKALGNSLNDHPKYARMVFLGVADTRNVPGFIRRRVTNSFPKDRTVLMDWKGSFSMAYGFKPDTTNILVFAPGGKLLRQVHGREVEPDILNGIEKTVRCQLNDL